MHPKKKCLRPNSMASASFLWSFTHFTQRSQYAPADADEQLARWGGVL